MRRQTTILVVDDDPDIRQLVHLYLKQEGYRLLHAENGEEAWKTIQGEPVDLIVLDLMMPGTDGLELCACIRKTKVMPIIMVTAKAGDLDKIRGLSLGADDYVTKPFNPLELVARIKAQLRRYQTYPSPPQPDVHTVGSLQVDVEKRQIWVEGRPIQLTPREFDIVALLVAHPGRVFSAEAIYQQVWGEPLFTSNNTVMVHIRNIREKIEASPRDPVYIKTVWGVGYKMEDFPPAKG